ncbi:hypothetical protein BJ165DRAFT_1476455 [Panaeolus papilionaceus]|nr:hypothetical protein BJ165DRAFT_1476455 [Panaeolus papilionaceus]
MGSDSDKPPSHSFIRLAGRRPANRICLILSGVLSLLLIIHYLFPSSIFSRPTSSPLQNYSNAALKSKNYLAFNASEIGDNPFSFCPLYGAGDEIGKKYGPAALQKSRLHLGSGARMQRVIARAMAGQPLTISVIGGSISACHGAGDDPISPKCYPSKFFQWWNSVFPHPASELTNGAMRRTNSAYFGYCNSHHLPDNTDLVIVELDTEDPATPETTETFELLIRSILLRPDSPAILLLGHFSPQIHNAHGFAGSADHWHTLVAQFYDIPHITTKSVLLPQYLSNPNSIKPYFVDPILASPEGHDVLSDVVVAYIQSVVCGMWGEIKDGGYEVDSALGAGSVGGLFGGVGRRPGVPEPKKGEEGAGGKVKGKDLSNAKAASDPQGALLAVPPGRMDTRPNAGRPYEEIAPFCVSANDLINPLPPSLFYGSGWFAYHPSTNDGAARDLKMTSHYFYSTLPTSKLRIPIQIGAGDVAISFIQHPINQIGEGSSVECWVDDNYGGAKTLENSWEGDEDRVETRVIDRFVGRGSHYVECMLGGEEGMGVPAFKIVGVFAT